LTEPKKGKKRKKILIFNGKKKKKKISTSCVEELALGDEVALEPVLGLDPVKPHHGGVANSLQKRKGGKKLKMLRA
jgi:hypothetical protein